MMYTTIYVAFFFQFPSDSLFERLRQVYKNTSSRLTWLAIVGNKYAGINLYIYTCTTQSDSSDFL